MKVLVFTTLYPNNIRPNQGVFIKERMTNFAKLDGCDVKVIAPVPYFPAMKLNWRWQFSQVALVETREGIEVHHPRYYMIPKVGMIFYGLMMFLSVLPSIRRLQKEFDFDVIDAHFVYPDGLAAVLLGRFFHKPVVVSARGSDINRYSTFPLIRKWLRYTVSRADRVITVSEALKKAIAKLGVPGEKIKVIPNGVDMEKFKPLSKKDARELVGLPAHQSVVLSVGHLTPNKGFDLVIRSMKVLTKEFQHHDVYLVIVGNGSAKAELEKLVAALEIEGRVLFAGAIAHEELYRWYSAADVFCLASGQEGWPNVLLESLACGTPVVATPVGGIPEIIRSEKLGLLMEREEAKIAEKISFALKHSWCSEDLVQYAKQHTWEHAAYAVRRVFETVLTEK